MTRINTKPLFLILRVFKLSEHLSAKVTTSGAPHTAAWGCDLVQKKQAWPTRPGGPNGGPAEAVTYVTEARGAGELWSTYRGAELNESSEGRRRGRSALRQDGQNSTIARGLEAQALDNSLFFIGNSKCKVW